jgi:hypothetical protein
MAAIASTSTTGQLDVGDTWLLGVEVRDDETGDLVDATVAITVTRPDNTTSNLGVTHDGTGSYRASYVLLGAGRHFAVASVSGGVVSVVTFAVDAVTTGALPTVANLETYLGESAAQYTADDLAEVLASETANQARKCRIGAQFPADLREALLRRCMRALAMRSLPLATLQGDAEAGSSAMVPWKDPEVKRLEGPYRKMVNA